MSTSFHWWESTFSESLLLDEELPEIDYMTKFWSNIFPPFSLLSTYTTNKQQYWKRIQRIIDKFHFSDADTPCPIQYLHKFIPIFHQFVQKLDSHSIPQLIQSLDCLPKSSDIQLILWSIPCGVSDPTIFLNLLDTLSQTQHWVWNSILNNEASCDLIFDRFISYLTHLSCKTSGKVKDLRIIAMNLVVEVFMSHPKFPDPFYSIFSRLCSLIKSNNPELSVHSYNLIKKLLDNSRLKLSSDQFGNYAKEFTESSISNRYLRRFIGPYILSLKIPSLNASYISRLLLTSKFDHNDLLFIEKNLISNNTEKSTSILLQLLALSINDIIYSRTILRIITQFKPFFDSQNAQITSFINRVVGLIIIARSRNENQYQVSISFDLLKTLFFNVPNEWLRNDISRGAALMLASEKVPLAFCNSLRPSMHCDKSELVKWERLANDQSFDLNNFIETIGNLPNVNTTKIERNVTVVKPIAAPIQRIRNVHKISSMPAFNCGPVQRVNLSSSISKSKIREVKKPIVRTTETKYFQIYKGNQS